jgi:hypothetical protein
MYKILTASNTEDLEAMVEAVIEEQPNIRLFGPPQANFSDAGDSAIWWQAIISASISSRPT